MTVNEVAVALDLAPGTVRNQIRLGKLRATKRGRDWHITPGETERYRSASLGRKGRPVGSRNHR